MYIDWPIVIDIIFKVGMLFIALYGLSTWKKEHIGKKKVELAEDVLTSFYEAFDVIKHIRFNGGFSYESDQIVKNDSESAKQYEARKKASVIYYRYKEHSELFHKIRSMRYRVRAQFGYEQEKLFDELHIIVTEILSSSDHLARLWAVEQPNSNVQVEIREYESVFWENRGERILLIIE